MSERPPPPLEGQMITAALERMRPRLPLREAARRVPISESRWRQIVQGYQMVSGSPVAIEAPAETLARMARVVGVQSFELREAGRADAANALQDLELEEKYQGRTTSEINDESAVIAAEIRESLRRQGRDLDERQRRVLDRWARNLLETLDEFDAENNA